MNDPLFNLLWAAFGGLSTEAQHLLLALQCYQHRSTK